MLVTNKKLMKRASENGYAVPAFNIDNLESAMAVSEVMHEMRLPVIVQTIPRTLRYGGFSVYPAMMNALMADCSVEYAMHLDHGDSLDTVTRCIACEFSSVMLDASTRPFEENVALTKEVTDYAILRGVSVEGEIGAIGGKEEGNTEQKIAYTTVEEAEEFVKLTNVSSLAIGVGTAHGIYKGTPVINIKRIEEIRSAVETPLVLHGASGLSDEVLKECIRAGISKINFATELRQAYTGAIRQVLAENPDVYDPKEYMRFAVDSIKDVLRQKISVCYNL